MRVSFNVDGRSVGRPLHSSFYIRISCVKEPGEGRSDLKRWRIAVVSSGDNLDTFVGSNFSPLTASRLN